MKDAIDGHLYKCDVTQEGAKLIDEFLQTWASRTAGAKRAKRADPEEELKELRAVVDEFRPRIEGNAWAAKVLESF